MSSDLLYDFQDLFLAFERAGFRLFLVGGVVRDLVMGRARHSDPSVVTDADFATDALTHQTAEVLSRNHFKVFPLGEKFGTITTLVRGAQVEITTFRVAEHYTPGSRFPRVEFGVDLDADLSRRDLSINAMAMDRHGVVHDPFDGRGAIQRRVLEVPGGGYNNTISILRDDPLRTLRIARFAARFGFEPSADTTLAARDTVRELEHISHERWKAELDKLLVAPSVCDGLAWLDDIGALDVLFPECAEHRGPDWRRALVSRIGATPRDLTLRWATLAVLCRWGHRLALPADADPTRAEEGRAWAATLAERFRMSNREARDLRALLALRPTRAEVRSGMSRPALRRLVVELGDLAGDAIALQLAAAEPGEHSALHALATHLERLLAEENPVPSLPTGLGRVIASTFGLPGPRIGDAMRFLHEAILDGELSNPPTEAACIECLARGFATPGDTQG